MHYQILKYNAFVLKHPVYKLSYLFLIKLLFQICIMFSLLDTADFFLLAAMMNKMLIPIFRKYVVINALKKFHGEKFKQKQNGVTM